VKASKGKREDEKAGKFWRMLVESSAMLHHIVPFRLLASTRRSSWPPICAYPYMYIQITLISTNTEKV
jgi:hypothetical protein